MTFTLKTYTMEQRIADTVPSGKYDLELEPILSDEASGWKNHVLKSNETLYDYDVMAARIKLKTAQTAAAAASTLLKKLHEELAVKSKDRRFVDSIKGIKASIATATDDVNDFALTIPQLKSQLAKLEGLKQIAILQLQSLRNIVSQYKQSRDLEYLRRGIHCIAEIAVEKSAIYV